MLFLHPMLLLIALTNSLEHVSIIGKLHYDAAYSFNYFFSLTTKCLRIHQRRLLYMKLRRSFWCLQECELRSRRFPFLCLKDSIFSPSSTHKSVHRVGAWLCKHLNMNHRLYQNQNVNFWPLRIHKVLPSFVSSSNCFSDIFRSYLAK